MASPSPNKATIYVSLERSLISNITVKWVYPQDLQSVVGDG